MTGTQDTAPTATGRTVARRTVVAAAGAVGLGAALVACGSDEPADSVGQAPADDGANSGGGQGAVLAKTADIPEGGGKVFEAQGVVVTQPSAGQFKAFSSECTHSGCAVGSIANGTITCPCHGSQFDASDGSVKKGPATKPLGAASITVEGDEIKLA
ncbi:Rieske (2Fe-2S) protein [Streptomyces sp. NP-1717]|uniref:Rieske (2Fe-2S) protein n=1 Tax=unclassified Streptomyces TaxID=2593676 RepID=UPI001F5DBE14|nr:Rieske (2Fe-2S) protein [Streptomyces sp. NP-1717]MCI3225107.1 Rieske (2Fe-2S) protein [Streptomyces sp. NP-1717]WTA72265.1 Rieske (2Fe-2S) protein [Streptomyces sp. NBC_00838]